MIRQRPPINSRTHSSSRNGAQGREAAVLIREVHVNFKSDYFPTEKMAHGPRRAATGLPGQHQPAEPQLPIASPWSGDWT